MGSSEGEGYPLGRLVEVVLQPCSSGAFFLFCTCPLNPGYGPLIPKICCKSLVQLAGEGTHCVAVAWLHPSSSIVAPVKAPVQHPLVAAKNKGLKMV